MNKNPHVPAEEIAAQAEYSRMCADIIRERYYYKIPLAYVHSFGCQQNVSDGEKIKGMLSQMGYGFTDNADEADFILFNTCAVREGAESRVFGNVGSMKKQKQRNPKITLALCGCMVQQEHISLKIKKSYPYVDLLFGTHVLHKLPQMMHERLSSMSRVFNITEDEGTIAEDIPIRRDGTVKAWVPIMYGCNNFCTYCVVPLVRGRERSRCPDRVLDEIRSLIVDGYKEVCLLGQNVNSYRAGSDFDMNFSQLLREINNIEGDFRIRFMTSHPKDASHELIDTIADCGKVCRHIHLPVQSGSDRILQLMNRGYTADSYLSLVEYAKNKIPGVAFTSDIIVGFPGETEEDFAKTLELVKRVGFSSLFTFIYSKREGTKAAQYSDQTPKEEIDRRFKQLTDLQAQIAADNFAGRIGQSVRVLVDSQGRLSPDYVGGRDDSGSNVEFKGGTELIGSFADVEITDFRSAIIVGQCRMQN
ncbi:MAG: tRNA (N6-isopentenyl adenosine(37)-C2)-methylthiotransferase MiaB [Oscillospiraceae bacterium]|nr:tRNA (N6-isopentenyl adenosine(37)-C2)-methylthiotransferase MiaB [Oscillospiraceae bacterium]